MLKFNYPIKINIFDLAGARKNANKGHQNNFVCISFILSDGQDVKI